MLVKCATLITRTIEPCLAQNRNNIDQTINYTRRFVVISRMHICGRPMALPSRKYYASLHRAFKSHLFHLYSFEPYSVWPRIITLIQATLYVLRPFQSYQEREIFWVTGMKSNAIFSYLSWTRHPSRNTKDYFSITYSQFNIFSDITIVSYMMWSQGDWTAHCLCITSYFPFDKGYFTAVFDRLAERQIP